MKRVTMLCILLATICPLIFIYAGENGDGKVPASVQQSLLDLQTPWVYYDGETDPVKSGKRTAWTEKDFDVSGWKTTPEGTLSKFGAKKGTLKSVDDAEPAVLLTQYKRGTKTNIEAFFFRTAVNVEEISKDSVLHGELLYDDAALVYLNGELVAEFANYQKEDLTKKFDENMQYGGNGSLSEGVFEVNADKLKEGENIIAVELHQCSASSSDIYFQMTSLDLRPFVLKQENIALNVGADETRRNIAWYANSSMEGVVQYGIKDGSSFPKEYAESEADVYATNDSVYYSHKAEMSGLKPDTTYVYRLVNDEVISPVYEFSTTGDDDFSFLAVGDTQIGADSTASDILKWDATLTKAKNKFPDAAFLLSAGDQVNNAGNEEQYSGYLDHDVLKSLPMATVIGNHDSKNAAYTQHFHNPNVTAYGATEAGTNYWYVYNDVLFMHMNSNSESIAEHRAFLEEAITAAGNVDWKVVAFHHSIYSAAGHAAQDSILKRRENYVPMFDDFDIDVVLMGHDHIFVRSYIMDGMTPVVPKEISDTVINPEGILYMTLNSSSGSKFYGLSGEYNYVAMKVQERIPNISHIEVTDHSFTITTYRIDESMSILDQFTIKREQPIEDLKISLAKTSYTYTGKAIKPKVSIKGLTEGKDYEVSYTKNKNPGKAVVNVKGKGKYIGTIRTHFTIKPKKVTEVTAKLAGHDDISISWTKSVGATGYKVYTKTSTASKYTFRCYTKKLSYTAKDLLDGKVYYVKVVPYVVIDKEKIDGGVAYSKSIRTLKKTGVPTFKKSGKKVKVDWVGINGESGYQLYKMTKKNGKYTVVYKYTSTKSEKLVSAKKGKLFYYKVRAYKVVDGERIYGPWSKTKSYKRM